MHVFLSCPSPLFLSAPASFPLPVEPPRYQTCVAWHDHIRHQANDDSGDDDIADDWLSENGHSLEQWAYHPGHDQCQREDRREREEELFVRWRMPLRRGGWG